MKNLFLLFLSAVVAIVMTTVGGVALAEAAPFHPGDALYPVQRFVENQALFRPTANDKASWYVQLVERRAADLAQQAGSANQADALSAFDEAVLQSARWLAQASPDTKAALQTRLSGLFTQVQPLLETWSAGSQQEQSQLLAVQARLETFQSLLANGDLTPAEAARITGDA
ncbi:MAG: hypothetical protein D6803_04940, partial [Anaerolineae bacterium]